MRCGIARPPRDARRIARRRPAAVLQIADAKAPVADRWFRERWLVRGSLVREHLATSDSWLSSFRTRIRAHGTTSRAVIAAVATVLFHPDFNRRLRIRTESADPFSQIEGTRRSRAWVLSTLTAGGDFHPALRTSAARDGWPEGKYGEVRPPQQAL